MSSRFGGYEDQAFIAEFYDTVYEYRGLKDAEFFADYSKKSGNDELDNSDGCDGHDDHDGHDGHDGCDGHGVHDGHDDHFHPAGSNDPEGPADPDPVAPLAQPCSAEPVLYGDTHNLFDSDSD